MARIAVSVTDRATRDIGYQLTDWLAPATGYHLPVRAAGGVARTISLRLDSSLAPLGDEGYQLSVTARQITIRARRPAGAFYAIETLRQLLPPDIFRAAPAVGVTWTVPDVQIEDTPRFSWRGAHLDVSRHFMPKEFVKKYIDLLALHKLNPSDSAIRFMQDVLTEVLALFPDHYIHIGGDEAVKYEWQASPVAQARIHQLGLNNENELQSWLTARMSQWLAARGRALVGWDEILEGGVEGLAPNAIVMSWRGMAGGIAAPQ